ncbi:MAG: hypothetical protein QM756_12895 [Polyangiaceae bacterium]
MRRSLWIVPALLGGLGCNASISPSDGGTGGDSSNGGAQSNGGAASTGGAQSAQGGATAAGGASASGGATSSSGGATSSSSGGATASGGQTASGGSMAGSTGSSNGPLIDRITTSDVTIAAGVKPGVRNYRVWGAATFKVAPVYVAPLANCGTLVCITTGTAAAPNARVVRLDGNDKLKDVLDLGAGLECRGIAAEPDGHFAALLWNGTDDTISVRRYDSAGAMGSSTPLVNSDNKPTDFGIGESRLEYGAGKYGAYYHVHSDSGHEGDTLKYVAAATGTETTTWSWGCSHSMSNLLTFNPASSSFLPTCVTDCYPGTSGSDFATASIGGVYLSNKTKVLDVDGGCNGSVAGELGGAAVAPSGWKHHLQRAPNRGHQGAVVVQQIDDEPRHRLRLDRLESVAWRRRLADHDQRRERSRLGHRALRTRWRQHRTVRRRLVRGRRLQARARRPGRRLHRGCRRRHGQGQVGATR